MTAPEVTHAVRDYLALTGGAEVSQIRLGLGCRATLAEIRGALKRIGADPRVFGDWPKYASNGARVPAYVMRSGGSWCAASRSNGMPNTVKPFTVYRLAR